MKKFLLAAVATASMATIDHNYVVSGKMSSNGIDVGVEHVTEQVHRLGDYYWRVGFVEGIDLSIGSDDVKVDLMFAARGEHYKNHAFVLGYKIDGTIFDANAYKPLDNYVRGYAAYQRRLENTDNYWVEVSLTTPENENDKPTVGFGIKKFLYSYD